MTSEIKIHSALTFDGEVQPSMTKEFENRKEMLKHYTETDKGKAAVRKALHLYSKVKEAVVKRKLYESSVTIVPGSPTDNSYVRTVAETNGGHEFRVLNRQADQSDGFKLKLVKGTDASTGKPIFTDDPTEALHVDGVFFYEGGAVLRIFNGYIPEKVLEDGTKIAGRNATQVTVEVLNMHCPSEITQEWVNNNVMGLSAYAFKVDGEQICPAGNWGQHGVNQKTTPLSILNGIMGKCHILIK
jgi:hypothetical protein